MPTQHGSKDAVAVEVNVGNQRSCSRLLTYFPGTFNESQDVVLLNYLIFLPLMEQNLAVFFAEGVMLTSGS
jgi:hypothetical protein